MLRISYLGNVYENILFYFNLIFIEFLEISYHVLQFHSFSSTCISALHPCSVLSKEKLKQK